MVFELMGKTCEMAVPGTTMELDYAAVPSAATVLPKKVVFASQE